MQHWHQHILQTLCTLPPAAGIDRSRVEGMETRLKQDILSEVRSTAFTEQCSIVAVEENGVNFLAAIASYHSVGSSRQLPITAVQLPSPAPAFASLFQLICFCTSQAAPFCPFVHPFPCCFSFPTCSPACLATAFW